jgi:hypothetical protein
VHLGREFLLAAECHESALWPSRRRKAKCGATAYGAPDAHLGTGSDIRPGDLVAGDLVA